MNFAEFEIIEKIRKSKAAIRKYQSELAKQEKASAENQRLVQRLGLDKNANGQALRASEESTIGTMRTKLAEMKAAHNKFASEHGYSADVLPE